MKDAAIIIAVMNLIISCIRLLKNNIHMEVVATTSWISIKIGIKNSMNGGIKKNMIMIILVMSQELLLIGEYIYSHGLSHDF